MIISTIDIRPVSYYPMTEKDQTLARAIVRPSDQTTKKKRTTTSMSKRSSSIILQQNLSRCHSTTSVTSLKRYGIIEKILLLMIPIVLSHYCNGQSRTPVDNLLSYPDSIVYTFTPH